MLVSETRRVPIAFLPTPITEMKRLSKLLGGPRIFVKRDDQTGLATGGNKARKLEFLIADALAEGADTVLTVGGPQSNHARQTAAAAAVVGCFHRVSHQSRGHPHAVPAPQTMADWTVSGTDDARRHPFEKAPISGKHRGDGWRAVADQR